MFANLKAERIIFIMVTAFPELKIEKKKRIKKYLNNAFELKKRIW